MACPLKINPSACGPRMRQTVARNTLLPLLLALTLTRCVAYDKMSGGHMKPVLSYTVSSSNAPYGKCLMQVRRNKSTNPPVVSLVWPL